VPHKLLLADDSVTIQRVIELTFADEDVQVIAVGDGRQAIERVQSERPDIVLADIGMPERDGYEVASFIKKNPALAHIPVLLLTGAFEPIDEGRARAAGCDGVLVKPFEPQMVISRVKELIAGRRAPQFDTAPAARLPEGATDTMRAATMAPRTPAPSADPATAPAGSIEDYFDRLDAAFASIDPPGATPAPIEAPTRSELFDVTAPPQPDIAPSFGGLAEELANWDPDLALPRADSSAPAAQASAPAPVAALPPAASTALPPAPEPFTPAAPEAAPAPAGGAPEPSLPAAGPVPSLAEAFAALLAAEQGQAFAPSEVRREAPAVTDELVEQVTQRVIERLADRSVRDSVLDVAERLVREEIARLKANAR